MQFLALHGLRKFSVEFRIRGSSDRGFRGPGMSPLRRGHSVSNLTLTNSSNGVFCAPMQTILSSAQPPILASNGPLKLRKALPQRLRSLGLDEMWLQNQIAADTTLLGLGELELLKREKIQQSGGRIDFLMADPDGETRFEIEVMLGAVDESHTFGQLNTGM